MNRSRRAKRFQKELLEFKRAFPLSIRTGEGIDTTLIVVVPIIEKPGFAEPVIITFPKSEYPFKPPHIGTAHLDAGTANKGANWSFKLTPYVQSFIRELKKYYHWRWGGGDEPDWESPFMFQPMEDGRPPMHTRACISCYESHIDGNCNKCGAELCNQCFSDHIAVEHANE